MSWGFGREGKVLSGRARAMQVPRDRRGIPQRLPPASLAALDLLPVPPPEVTSAIAAA